MIHPQGEVKQYGAIGVANSSPNDAILMQSRSCLNVRNSSPNTWLEYRLHWLYQRIKFLFCLDVVIDRKIPEISDECLSQLVIINIVFTKSFVVLVLVITILILYWISCCYYHYPCCCYHYHCLYYHYVFSV